MILNFKPHFKDLILSGEKDQTVRRVRKRRPIVIGDTLHMYTGARTPEAEEFARTTCTNTASVVIGEDYIDFDGCRLDDEDASYFVQRDGFIFVADFRGFFREHYGLPFYGVMIQWEPLDPGDQYSGEENG